MQLWMDKKNWNLLDRSYWLSSPTSRRQLEDLAFAGKLCHQFEQQDDGFGNRIFEKANSCLVFESFQMLDMECAPAQAALIIVASDAAHRGNVVFRPMYCKLFFYVPCILVYCWGIYFSACWFNLKQSERSKGLNWVASWWFATNFAWIPNYDDALCTGQACWRTGRSQIPPPGVWAPVPVTGLRRLGPENSTSSGCVLGRIYLAHKFYLALHWLIILSWTILHVHMVNFIAY